MLAAIGAHLCGDIAQFLVYEPEASHSAIQCLTCRRIFESYRVNPITELMAPVVVVKLFGNSNAKIQQLHFYKTLGATVIFYLIITPSEKTAQLLPLHIGNVDALEPAIL